MNTRHTSFGLTLVVLLSAASAVIAQKPPVQGPAAMALTAVSANVNGAGEKIDFFINRWSTEADRDRLVTAWTLAPAPAGAGRNGAGRGGAAPPAAAPAAPAAAAPAAPVPAAAPAAPPAAAAAATAPPAAAPATPPAATQAAPATAAPAAPPAAAAGRGGRGGRGGGAPAAAPRTPESALTTALQTLPAVGYFWTSEVGGYLIRYAYQVPQPDGSSRIILVTDKRLGAAKGNWRAAAPATPNTYGFTLIDLRLPAKGAGSGKASLTGTIAVDAATKTLILDGYDALPVTLQDVKTRPTS